MTDEALAVYRNGKTIKIVFSPNGIIMSVNSNFEKATGYLSSEIEGRHVSILRHECIPSLFYEKAFIDISSSCILEEIMVCQAKNGDAIWSKGPVYPIYDEDQDVVGFCSRKLLCSNLERNQAMLKIAEKYEVDMENLRRRIDEE